MKVEPQFYLETFRPKPCSLSKFFINSLWWYEDGNVLIGVAASEGSEEAREAAEQTRTGKNLKPFRDSRAILKGILSERVPEVGNLAFLKEKNAKTKCNESNRSKYFSPSADTNCAGILTHEKSDRYWQTTVKHFVKYWTRRLQQEKRLPLQSVTSLLLCSVSTTPDLRYPQTWR